MTKKITLMLLMAFVAITVSAETTTETEYLTDIY